MEGILQGIYRPRNPQATSLYRLVEDNFDELEHVWDERYEKQHGFWRPIIRHVVEQYLTCGDLRCVLPGCGVRRAVKIFYCLI
jgi:hypothetical protein